ncbi:MAG: dockerin type I repeat-containing protein [Ruminococcus sp.]|nr:dockerin type I repeat-containing protein [Ruminococcus sp.]
MRKRVLSLLLCAMLMLTLLPMSVFAKNTEGANLIKEVSIADIQTPYVGEHPNYYSKLGNSAAYTYDDQLDDDPDAFEGKWWYDETTQNIVSPDDTFIEGHIYTLGILLVANEGYEFRVDNYNTPFISAYVNGNEATVVDDLTDRYQAMIEYTFKPCDYNYEISALDVKVTEPKAGGYPDFNIEIETDGVVKDSLDSPYYIYGVAWYDCKTHTFMNPSDPFEEDGVYEVNIVLATIGDYYFATKNDKTNVTPYINGKEGVSDGAGTNDKYKILVSYIFGDAREEVSYVEITDIKEPAVGASPIFTATPVKNTFYVSGIFWTDVTNTTAVSMKETDKFEAGHTYKLEVWIRANEKYKFSTDEDGYIDIAALVGGHQAEVILPGSEISAELSLTFTLTADTVVSFVDVINVDAPVAGRTPDFDAFCTTRGCNVSNVEWYDTTEGRGTLMAEDAVFEAGRSYRVVVRVDSEGNYTYEQDDMDVNIAEGNINGQKAVAYSSYDNTYLELGLDFAPCEKDTSNIVSTVEIEGIDAPVSGNTPDYDAICLTPGCEILNVEWWLDTADSRSILDENATFEAGKSYRVVVTVEATGGYTFIIADGYNEAEGFINGKNAVEYGSHDDKELELGLAFAPCEGDVTPIGILGDADASSTVNVKDATAIQKHVASLITLSDTVLVLSDVDASGNVNVKDATAIQKWVAGIETGFAIGEPV